ncbi:MAG: universal stress protein [Rhodocyclaceae bacterium]|nr:universal stress protein [Rhodocyclaceae bacterium]
MFKHILVPTDGSSLSHEAVVRAVDFAREIGAKITFFYAQPEFPVAFYGEGAFIDTTTPEKFAEMTEQQAQSILSPCLALAQQVGVACDAATSVSDAPYEAIIETATQRGCDLIFMASHGRRGLGGLLLGSETQKVLTHTKIPVLVYR